MATESTIKGEGGYPPGSDAAKRERVSGSGSITWRGPGANAAAAGVLVLEWPDKLFLEVQDPLGARQALLIINGERFWWESAEETRAVTGRLNHSEVRRILPLPIQAADLVQALLARPEPGASGLSWSRRESEPEEWKREDGRGGKAWVRYQAYEVRQGLRFPTEIRLEAEGRARDTVVWRYTDWQPRLPRIDNVFQIPPKQSIVTRYKTLQ